MTSENLARIFVVVLIDDINFDSDINVVKFIIDNK